MKLSIFRTIEPGIIILMLLPSLAAAQSPWQQVTVPSVKEAAANFVKPPAEYGAIHWAIWGGQQTKERIVADINQIHANGGTVYMLSLIHISEPTRPY